MTETDHVIWTNNYLDYEDCREYLEEEYPELSEDERYRIMIEDNAEHLDDERMNLDITLGEPIIVIADLGLWFGRRMGYKEIQSGNIKDCLYSEYDYTTWYVDNDGEFRCEDIHHDGINNYLYRVWKKSADDLDREVLTDKIYRGVATPEDIDRYTDKLGEAIGKVYGWEFDRKDAKVHDAR